MTRPRVLVLNGPNLNFLGRREPALYGSVTLDAVTESLAGLAAGRGVSLDCRQSNSEAVLIDAAQEAMSDFDAVIINAGGLSHSSVALRDALAMLPVPVVEVHVTNIHAREEFRHHSFISDVAAAVIVGAGTNGYLLALEHVLSLLPAAQPAAHPGTDAGAAGGSQASALVLSGPNLNFLGRREPGLYGDVTLDQIGERVATEATRLGMTADFRQSNSESELVDAAQEAMSAFDAVIINPAGLSFTSIPLRDALAMLPVPVIEVHITNIMARPAEYLHHSHISPIATAVIMGAGAHGYELALQQAAHLAAEKH
ncbi:type II 3-dehydroquinate dehydratase [Leifsonia sp. Root112D2]|uniref:type II 3-dehydroquinate dehydratase n=1 Tax=Leifsonia sp. Root112D2 TaxID=1736426 RepID=UPI000ACF6FD2